MSTRKELFPVVANDLIVPPDFHVFAINLLHEKCHFLQRLDCQAIIVVTLPPAGESSGRGAENRCILTCSTSSPGGLKSAFRTVRRQSRRANA